MPIRVSLPKWGFRLAWATGPLFAALAIGAQGDSARSHAPQSADPVRRATAAAEPKSHEVSLANGLVMAHTGAEHGSALVMRRKPDGSIVYECVHGLAAASDLVKKEANATRRPSQSKNGGRLHEVR